MRKCETAVAINYNILYNIKCIVRARVYTAHKVFIVMVAL